MVEKKLMLHVPEKCMDCGDEIYCIHAELSGPCEYSFLMLCDTCRMRITGKFSKSVTSKPNTEEALNGRR